MAQDTRKDPRAKVLTMTVRYKSATVDEFIEHHSHDVSRGGIYIKTPSPFQPGTLLKFEIRIADEKPMLQGVGRVVWKRETAGPGSDKPAGMGVKFIKVDEASRHLIDRLVSASGDQVSSYDAEVPMDAGGSMRSTQAGIRPPDAARPAVAPAAGSGSMRRAGTMIGLGTEGAGADTIAAARGVQRPSQPPRPNDSMFPKTDSEGDMPPPEERTVMKQAAQLLEEALKGAGGSMEELGGAQGEPVKPIVTEAPKASPTPVPSAPVRASPTPAPAARTAGSDRAAKARAVPEASRASAGSAATVAIPTVDKKAASSPKIGLSLLLVAAAAGAAYIAWQNQAAEPEPSAGAPPAITAAPPPTVAAVPVAPAASLAPIASVAAPEGALSAAAAPLPIASTPSLVASAAASAANRAPALSAAPPSNLAPAKPAALPTPAPTATAPAPAAGEADSVKAPKAPAPPREAVKPPPAARPKPKPDDQVAPAKPPSDDNPY